MRSLSTALVLAASAALASAQETYSSDGKFTCAVANAVYCGASSMTSNIIMRCNGTVGEPGNCNDNLAGEFPLGVGYSACYSPSLGLAACSKNCVVYGGSGNIDGTFTLSNCTPTATKTSTTPIGTSASSYILSTSPAKPPTVTYVTVTAACDSSTSAFSQSALPSGTGSFSVPYNGTIPTTGATTVLPTATPVGPTTTTSSPAVFAGAAVANHAGLGFAVGGLIAAYFL